MVSPLYSSRRPQVENQDRCRHTEEERQAAASDGACVLCMAWQIAELRAQLELMTARVLALVREVEERKRNKRSPRARGTDRRSRRV